MEAGRSQRVRSGLTMMELVVVLTIVTMMSTLSIASFRTMIRQSRVSEEGRNMVTVLQAARMRAVSTGMGHGVYIGGPADPQYPNQLFIFRKADLNTTSIEFAAGDGGISGDIKGDVRRMTASPDGGYIPGLVAMAPADSEGGMPLQGHLVVFFVNLGQVRVDRTLASGAAATSWEFTDTNKQRYLMKLSRGEASAAPLLMELSASGTARIVDN
jgi:type II secretory pathway pseudopilin PulG